MKFEQINEGFLDKILSIKSKIERAKDYMDHHFTTILSKENAKREVLKAYYSYLKETNKNNTIDVFIEFILEHRIMSEDDLQIVLNKNNFNYTINKNQRLDGTVQKITTILNTTTDYIKHELNKLIYLKSKVRTQLFIDLFGRGILDKNHFLKVQINYLLKTNFGDSLNPDGNKQFNFIIGTNGVLLQELKRSYMQTRINNIINDLEYQDKVILKKQLSKLLRKNNVLLENVTKDIERLLDAMIVHYREKQSKTKILKTEPVKKDDTTSKKPFFDPSDKFAKLRLSKDLRF